ncbi:hypothetical protein [Actinomadura rupiterrae]|uniref:hypothetical protein n=1 Tax=Actinomadura rupiterrae TaxID=559627 RepID=UPI0020A602E0|nr:hypothetical protein [Actinomadura rupiterrae]MCP2336559.1 hypothetical protein [Actinomadura rupiterrae]
MGRLGGLADPTGFVAGADRMAIDENQCVPELLLAIKEEVDADPRPDRTKDKGEVDAVLENGGGRSSASRSGPLRR